MDQGWIKLYRKSIESRVFQNEGLWKVWTWCLLKVNHSTQWVSLKTGRGSIEVECKRGQFIFGRLAAAKELNMNATTVWKRMQKLKNMQNIDIKSNSQYSVITLLNMSTYQPDEIKSDSKSDQQVTSKEQASDTNKNEKNEKNEKKKDMYVKFTDLNMEAWNKWLSYKKQIKKNYKTENGERTKITELLNLSNNNQDLQMKIVEQSINEEYQGLFPLKKDNSAEGGFASWK